MSKSKVIAIVGPTSSGKTGLSIEIAKTFNGEVISADSRQVYRGMDICTGKVTKEEMGGIPHHLIDIADPMDIYTAANFEQDASSAIKDITGQDKQPIIAGGTFFYIELLRGNIQSAPVEPNEEFRKGLEIYSNEELYQKLQSSDPERANTIDPDNRRRLERALEIIDALGEVPKPTKIESPYEWLLIGVDVTKETLHKNIHDRLLARLEAGMVEEVKNLLERGVTYERLDELGLEYRYIAKYLQKEISYEEMVPLLETKIRQYAKRQLTWLRRYKEIEWFEPSNKEMIFKSIKGFLTQ